MLFLDQLKKVEKQLLKASPSVKEFPAVTRDIVQGYGLTFDRGEFARHFISLRSMPKQHYSPLQFGSFNYTIASNKNFSVQLYFMDLESTELHRHGFYGYYQYLEGDSLQLEYSLGKKQKIENKVYEVKLIASDPRRMGTGQGQVVHPDFVHQLHRCSPTTTVLMFMHHDRPLMKEELIIPPYLIQNPQVTDLDLRKMLLMANTQNMKWQKLWASHLKSEVLFGMRFRLASLRHFQAREKLADIETTLNQELTSRGYKLDEMLKWFNHQKTIKLKLSNIL